MSTVSLTVDDGVALIKMDDGKANVFSHQAIDEIHGALDAAEKDAKAVVIAGREGKFSGGFDLATMMKSEADAMKLVGAGGRLLMRLYLHPQPVVAACTGHAIAAGALCLLSCDTRIAQPGPFKIGLNETMIGMRLPVYAVELARDRLSKRHLTNAAIQARMYDPVGAANVGYVDRVIDEGENVVDAALAEARVLGELSAEAYATTKKLIRGRMVEYILETLDDDMRGVNPY